MRLLAALMWCLTITSAKAEWHAFSDTAMTTDIQLEFWLEDREKAKNISSAVFAEFDRIEKVMSRYMPDAELTRVNQGAAKAAIKVSAELFALLKRSQQISALSEGAFDITFASVGKYYDYRENKQPDAKQIQSLKEGIDYRHLELNQEDLAVRYLHEGVVVDLGGIAKGYAIEKGIELLRGEGVENASLSAGGDMYLLGDKRGKPWIVAIKDPRNADKHAVVLPLFDAAMSTSGDYERYFLDESGQRIHHILSPKSGRPAEGIQSVSILANDTVTSDALSTAVFVMGVEQGLAMINSLDDVDAIIIDAQRKMHYSQGLMAGE